ncbi:hypothetical protein J1N35_004750 [Gossypium stocksii]|uniref:Reverse transcriptase zinc-binding domain-containing protein n=1 Tax=Gossypium stocksii TaxID=47602 RepID=A0A9D3WER9_9ROSI|nr:hypothetical protein J1N35_004750 [Gossypium stocksii]
MVIEEESWNLDLFWIWLLEEIIECIFSIPPPHPSIGFDIVPWVGTTSNTFSIKNAYKILKENSWSSNNEILKLAWKYQGPWRVRFFIWLIRKQHLLTQVERQRQGIEHNDLCPNCGIESEKVIHAIRNYNVTKDIWTQIIPAEKHNHFFSGNLQE